MLRRSILFLILSGCSAPAATTPNADVVDLAEALTSDSMDTVATDVGPMGDDLVEDPDTALAPDAGTTDVSDEAPCEPLQLLAESYDGLTTALYAVGRVGVTEGAFHLDSASYTSLLFLPVGSGWQDHAGDVRFGCRDVPVPGWDGLGTLPDVDGYPVVGMAGIDLFRVAPTRLDVTAATLTWDPPDFAERPGAIDLTHQWVQGQLLVTASFDDVAVTVVVDTGAAHTLWLGVEPEPGDVEVTTEDALGDPLTVWLGTASLGLGNVNILVPMLRAPSFPVLEQTARRLGRELGGLIGLSAMERLYIDDAAGALAVVPRGL